MNRTYKIALGIFLLLLAGLTYLEANQPPPLNWNPSYKATDKIPLGSYVLFENLRDQEFPVQQIGIPPYEMLQRDSLTGTYFFLNDQLVFDDAALGKMLEWVEQGNTIFLAANVFSENLLDTLGLKTGTAIPQNGISSKPMFNLAQEQLKNDRPYILSREIYHNIFTEIDTSKHLVLGISELYSDTLKINDPEINYIKVPFGEGAFLLHTTPQAFSNVFLIEDENFRYAENALAYIPLENTLYWDNYYKTGKSFQTSPLYILLAKPSLKWTYYFVIIGSILFIIFEGRRKQRSIPVIPPLKNRTYEYTRTIAGLYLEKEEYRNIALKKIGLFLEFIRNEYRIPTVELGEKFYIELSASSGKSREEITDLFKMIREIQNKQRLNREDLLRLNSVVNSFKTKNDGK
ncbi:MAG TPA: DUF4350 domain-containing protein [Salinimicrobium sp.]|nr:DUF4350 domain-containing protein [Salinimicrobium sp.]